ncbi:hypothetical protein LCGC14_0579650 [marine sediment metagenome]|uniref:Uncharacterized protein n=1 Tax=marine sediment metagenome TaxID=412755 RepID=A0A0F9UPY1_9ZZZZ
MPKTIKFICPKCGCNRLVSIESIPVSRPIINISSDGDHDYGKEEQGDIKVRYYKCSDCDFVVSDTIDATIIKDVVKLGYWCKMNCKQE